MFLAWAAWLVLKYFQWVMTYFVVTSRRVIYRTGVLSKKGVEIPLERINNINFHQRIIDRIIGAGDLDIESAGKDGQSHFDFVRHPDGVQHEIYRQMETRNMPQNFPRRGSAGGARARLPRRRSRACPIRSSSSRTCATRGTSRPRSTSRRSRSSSAVCSYPTGTGTASISVSHGRPAALRSSHFDSTDGSVWPSSSGVGPMRSAMGASLSRSKL